MITAKRVAGLLAEAEADVVALRRVLALCNGHARTAKAETIEAVVGRAIAVRGGGVKYGAKFAAVKAKRQETARILKAIGDAGRPLSTEEIVGIAGRRVGFGSLMRGGLLKKTAAGKYARTAKVFIADKGAADRAKRAGG